MLHPPSEIATARLLLRRPRPSDTTARFAFGSDPEVGRYMDWTVLTDIGQLYGAAERNAAKWASGEEYAWLITLPATGHPIGTISCRIDGHCADFGYLLATDHWGHGYATEAAQAVFDWLAGHPEIVRVWTTCDTENTASVRILEKLGMTREATLRAWAIRPNLAPGVPRDAYLHVWIREG